MSVFDTERGGGLVVGSLEGAFVAADSITDECCDLVELRLDGWCGEVSAVQFASSCALPVLVTARDPIEGGKGGLVESERVSLIREHLSVSQAIDVEARNLDTMAGIWSEAGDAGLLRVASAHNFEEAFSFDEMAQITEMAMVSGADVAKFAYRMHSVEEIELGMALLNRFVTEPIQISVMGMGALGPESRVRFGRHGSILNYGYLGDKETAPGQMAAKILKSKIHQDLEA